MRVVKKTRRYWCMHNGTTSIMRNGSSFSTAMCLRVRSDANSLRPTEGGRGLRWQSSELHGRGRRCRLTKEREGFRPLKPQCTTNEHSSAASLRAGRRVETI
jgi:hypothetical protein